MSDGAESGRSGEIERVKESPIELSLRRSREKLIEYAKKVESKEILPTPFPAGWIYQRTREIDPNTKTWYTIDGRQLRHEGMAISLSYDDIKLIGFFTLLGQDGEGFDIDPDDYEWVEDLPDEKKKEFRLTYFKEDLYLPPLPPKEEV